MKEFASDGDPTCPTIDRAVDYLTLISLIDVCDPNRRSVEDLLQRPLALRCHLAP